MSSTSTERWPQEKSRYGRLQIIDCRLIELLEEDCVSRRLLTVLMMSMAVIAVVTPLHAQEAVTVVSPAAGTPGGTELIKWTIITAGFALAIAAAFGALGQSRGLAAAVEGIARNPSAAGEIRGNLILGLVLIESLVIYVLLISLILFFVKPFGG